MNTIDLQGRRAAATGGAKGIGYGIAKRLLDSGAAVYLCYNACRHVRRHAGHYA